jgi:hypothetical protein
MNKVAQVNDAAFALVRSVCLAQGLPEAAITRNALQELTSEDGEDLADYGEAETKLNVAFMDGRPTTVAMSLSPKRYELAVGVKVAVISIGDEALGRVARIALIDALGVAFDADNTLGGLATWAEMADDPEEDDEEDMGAEARVEIVMFQIDVADALTPRG